MSHCLQNIPFLAKEKRSLQGVQKREKLQRKALHMTFLACLTPTRAVNVPSVFPFYDNKNNAAHLSAIDGRLEENSQRVFSTGEMLISETIKSGWEKCACKRASDNRTGISECSSPSCARHQFHSGIFMRDTCLTHFLFLVFLQFAAFSE